MAVAQPIRTAWNPEKKHTEVERWICIYPAYINSKKTRQEGRRIPKQHSVENPTCMEIRDVLSVTNLNIAIENKLYSREKSKELPYRGRIRVQLKNDDGSLCYAEFPTRESILLYLGQKIPQLKSRQNKSGDSAQSHQGASGSGGGVSGGGGGGGHKKGKGKRR